MAAPLITSKSIKKYRYDLCLGSCSLSIQSVPSGLILKTIEDIFGKPADNLDISDIAAYFRAQPHESQHLEFKSGKVTVSKLLKEVCAFLNSEGGLLILGAPREEGGNPPLDLCPVPSSDIIKQQILGGIVPRPDGLRIQRVPDVAGSVYLIEVPASTMPPHQLPGSGQYYLRQGAVSRPAMHEEVERMFLQQRQPDLDLQIEIERPDDALLVRLILSNTSTISASEPGFAFRCFPVRFQDNGSFERQVIARNNYLAQGQRWVQEFTLYPSEPRFFIHCQYFCRNVKPRLKAAFAEIIHRKVDLLSVYNSEVHADFEFWYEENLYLLND
jgi:hypothetical protein